MMVHTAELTVLPTISKASTVNGKCKLRLIWCCVRRSIVWGARFVSCVCTLGWCQQCLVIRVTWLCP